MEVEVGVGDTSRSEVGPVPAVEEREGAVEVERFQAREEG